jgi:hypothetical protein
MLVGVARRLNFLWKLEWAMLFHTIMMPDGMRTSLNLFDVVLCQEVDGDEGPALVVVLRTGSSLIVKDPQRELLDGILAKDKGYPEAEAV